jgi:hypothetical protein
MALCLFGMMVMVDTYGLPHLFFKLSSNETLELKWNDISNMETLLKDLGEEFSWKNFPIECAHLFHKRVHTFMTKYIKCENIILGRVEHHMRRYEVQHKLSLYGHMYCAYTKMMWAYHK